VTTKGSECSRYNVVRVVGSEGILGREGSRGSEGSTYLG